MGNSNEKCSSAEPEMKPIPQSSEELETEKKILSLMHLKKPNAEPSPRAKLCHFMLASEQIKRSSCHASILLVGVSGVGKSSTMNHLLNSGSSIQFAKTDDTKSSTRDTTELILTVDEPKFEVSGLQLGIVDTPGFSDTASLEQEACNFYSIKKFYETHPKLSGCYPNLIFLLVPATDTRIEGPNTNLSKSLRCLQQLGLVDQLHPNVVAILSFCCSVPHNTVTTWEKKMKEKKECIERIVSKALNVTGPVVVLENSYGDWGLKVDGDFTRLPNGQLQPKNLYNACKEVLKANSDHFGLMSLNACFDKPTKKSPTNGHKTKTKNAGEETLTADEKEFVKLIEKAAKGVAYASSLMTIRPAKKKIDVRPIHLAQFDFVEAKEIFHEKRRYLPRATIALTFKRRSGYYILQIYIPSMFLVVLSWLAFCMNTSDISDRFALGITMILSIVFLHGGINTSLPPVSYAKASDWFVIVSFAFIFLALLETVAVYRISLFKERKQTEHAKSTILKRYASQLSCKSNMAELVEISPEQDMAPGDKSSMVASEDHNLTLKSVPASLIDKTCIIVFPALYICFNIFYWSYYTHIE